MVLLRLHWWRFWLLPIVSYYSLMVPKSIVRVSEDVWRAAATQHVNRVLELLQPGLTSPDDAVNFGGRRKGSKPSDPRLTSLNPQHPTYNFLVEYYGLKGQKGTKRLSRWSPKLELLTQREDRISQLDQLVSPATKESEVIFDGILLEGASENDMGDTLHLRGAMPHEGGMLYSPKVYFNRVEDKAKVATPYLWYRSIIQQTLKAEPVLHCHGLHEWAMLFWPEGADPPPSAKYQAHLPLRVSREIINAAVERRGISCTHVDALRFFAPAAGPLNHHGHSLEREEQLNLEQPACVHAHMDLLKMAMKLEPFNDPILLQKVLQLALAARKMDVAASPYDASSYGVPVIPIETRDGRAEYRRQQIDLMERAEPVRQELLRAYDLLIATGFEDHVREKPSADRYTKAEPGGLPWRKNPISHREINAVGESVAK